MTVAELAEEQAAWRKAMGFPRPDQPHLPPPSLNEDAMYYLTRAEGQLVRLNELFSKVQWQGTYEETKEFSKVIKAAQIFLASLRIALDTKRYDVT